MLAVIVPFSYGKNLLFVLTNVREIHTIRNKRNEYNTAGHSIVLCETIKSQEVNYEATICKNQKF